MDVPLGDTVPSPAYGEDQPARRLTRINGALGVTAPLDIYNAAFMLGLGAERRF